LRLYVNRVLSLLILIIVSGCSASIVPPEVEEAEKQEHHLWRAEAPIYLPEEYDQYKALFHEARKNFIRENSRFHLFRNYTSITLQYRNVLNAGAQLYEELEKKKQELSANIPIKILSLRKKINTLRGLISLMNEGRLARQDLVKADVALLEAEKYHEKSDYKTAEDKMLQVSSFINAAEEKVMPIVNRYGNQDQVKKWQHWANKTIDESKTNKNLAIIVNKSRRTLTLYKSGNPWKTYQIGIGRNGTRDKLHSGDHATPEGTYKIVKKLPKSRYYKALLINYPNKDDRKQFLSAKKKGLIPEHAGIGGLIEIHGGGRDSMTYGCIALDNHAMKELYNLVHIDTPVTIVGAVNFQNRISSALQEF
jgi:L,D-peptidoglycan transpeptidase YkuD (ErfK/YbiS/YcfS/YnhG family)